MNQERIQYIDIAKGIAILIVVTGHVIQWNTRDIYHSTFIDWIRGIQMPLFMFMSGYIAAIKRSKNVFKYSKTFLYKKSITLLLPYISWGILVDPIILQHQSWNDYCVYLVHLISRPDYGLWFLLSLFIIQINFFTSCLIANKLKSIGTLKADITGAFIMISIMILLNKFIFMNFVGTNYYFPYFYSLIFYFGYTMNRYFIKWIINDNIAAISLLIFAILCWRMPFGTGKIYITISNAICASVLLIFFCHSFDYSSSKSKIFKSFIYLGKNSLVIYCTHYIFLPIIPGYFLPQTFHGNMLIFIICIVIALFISFISAWVGNTISRIHITGLILYGKKKIH